MAHDRKHQRIGRPFDLPPRWRWVRLPVIILGGGGTAVVLWEEEVLLTECAPLAFLPLLAAPLYLFNYLVFKATRLHRNNLSLKEEHQTTSKGHRS